MLPDGSGCDFCAALRDRNMHTPVLMLTARGDLTDRVTGLRMGADDYVPKPFDVSELLARVEALRRRAGRKGRAQAVVFEFGEISVNFNNQAISEMASPLSSRVVSFRC
jgi:DNA-binding response OmpR family regulator